MILHPLYNSFTSENSEGDVHIKPHSSLFSDNEAHNYKTPNKLTGKHGLTRKGEG